jgi:hypothetical protein
MMKPNVKPLKFHGGYHDVEYDALCIPAISPEGNWSLKNLQVPEDAVRHPEIAERVGRALFDRGITDAYAPAVDKMSARIVPKSLLSKVIRLPYGVNLYRNHEVPADGVALGRGHAFIMSGGGCPVVVAAGKNSCIVTHASRDSLLDRNHIRKTGEPRDYASVIRAIIGWSAKYGNIKPGQLSLRGFFTIPTADFSHPPDDPVWGEDNILLAEFIRKQWSAPVISGPDLCLSIPELIMAQAAEGRFGPTGMERELPSSGAFGYTRHSDEAMRTVRNLVIVHRTR